MTDVHADGQAQPEQLTFSAEDWYLGYLVTLAEAGAKIPVTLTVGGATITGYLSSEVSFLKDVRTAMAAAEVTDSASGEFMQEVLQLHDKVIADRQSLEASEGGSPTFVHLTSARYADGAGMVPTGKGVNWRGRVDRVDGFSIGIFTRG